MQRRILPLSEQDTPGLLQALARVPDPRDAGDRIHPLPGLLAIAIAAVVSGSSHVVEIVKWAADLPDAAWDRLGATRDAFTGVRRVPDDSTLSRVLTGIDADALDAAVCRWLLSRAGLTGAGRRVIAVDGRTLRGSGPTGAQVHLLAALNQAGGGRVGEVGDEARRYSSPLVRRVTPRAAMASSEAAYWSLQSIHPW
ncbi:transposase family protein [Micromonospora trifolii]|uniref:transposase family protein n=1 Tax=Micromonospora trifolii TaxID=2911208 RepID=UPI003D2EDB34